MGSPKKPKKTYSRPFKIWDRARLDEEKPTIKEFGLKNKKELWKAASLLRKYSGQAKRLIPLRGKQADIEKTQLIGKLSSLGAIEPNASLDEVLGLGIKDFLERRLQTVVFRKRLARSITQSRQFITHKHVSVKDKIITSPSSLVPLSVEGEVGFVDKSGLSKPDHPERVQEKKEVPDAKE